jgi:DNA-binding CsgD family transcriptional regulator/GAF domain-containing protein
MERLRRRDLHSLLSYLREIYVLDGDSFANRIVETVPRLVPSEVTSYNEVDPTKQSVKWVSKPVLSALTREGSQGFERHVHEHPIIRYHQQNSDGRTLKISDFLTRRQFHQLALYNEFYRKVGVEYQMAAILPTPAPLVFGIALNRSERDFSERERLLLDLLRPHLARAYRNAEAMAQLQWEAAHQRQALEELERGVISLTEQRRVRWHTEKALRMLAEYFEPATQTDRLPESLSRWVGHQRSLLSGDEALSPREPLVIERPGKRLAVHFVGEHGREGDLLLLEERFMSLSIAALESLGFTRRETEVLFWMVRGKSNGQIAATLFISPDTVRKHVEHIHRKLGVAGRNEAVARVLEISGLLQQ